MTRYGLFALSALTLTLPSPAQAHGDARSGSEIVVDGEQHVQRGHWLTTSGPDELGQYTATIYVGDLDPATESGWTKMTRRVSLGTALLCDRAQAQPHVAGFYNGEQRACWAETRGQAQAQMERARDAARGGERIAMIGFGLR